MTKKKIKSYDPKVGDIVTINDKYGFPTWIGRQGEVLNYHEYGSEVSKKREQDGFFTLSVEKSRNPVCVYKDQIDLVERPEKENE